MEQLAKSTEVESFAELRQQVQFLIETLQQPNSKLGLTGKSPADPTSPANSKEFFASGLFFICLGLALLFASYLALDRGVHTSFSFVLVVLGIAILLFGTGTQGIGTLDSTTPTARVSGIIAGGAGVLAIIIGFGMIEFGGKMRQAFDLETRYVAAKLRPASEGISSFDGYWAEFTIDGVPIPSLHRGKFFFAYVPYKDTQTHDVLHIEYVIRATSTVPVSLQARVTNGFDIPIQDVRSDDRASDFPTYDKIPPIDMKESPKTLLVNSGGSRTLEPVQGTAAPDHSSSPDLGGS